MSGRVGQIVVSRVALVLVLVAMATAGCDSKKDTAAVPQEATSTPATSAAIPAPAPVDWGQCAADGYNGGKYPDGAECGTLEVPVDYAKPDGAKAQLALIRFKATGDKVGSLVVNPGGPGLSGVEYAADDEEYLTPPILERFDRVGFDPRGVGGSTPAIRCDSDADFDRSRADAGVMVNAADAERENAETRQFVQRCIDKVGQEFLANAGTANVVKDLDQLRAALGDAKLTYLGYSYGTQIGSQYAEAFPQNVRAIVLDGAIDPSVGALEALVDQSAAFQKVFDNYAADCAAAPRCPLGSDPAKAVAVFHQLVDPLVRTPALTDDPRGLTYQDALMGTADALYDDDSWPTLTDGLRALAAGGHPDELLALADEYYERDEDGHYSNSDDAFTSIDCVDRPYPKDPAAYLEFDKRVREVEPFRAYGSFTGQVGFLGNYSRFPANVCSFWPAPPTTQPHRASAPGLPTVLVISTTDDPATPYQNGVDLAEQLGGALLTFEGSQHTASFFGNTCVDDATTKYLIDLTVPPKNTRC
ncbi:MAG TPA: alpha/beta hydrolase [Mycobacterium sp.]|nr:alpha/beta hydrolase [Mycobacterium sp.]